MTGQLLKRTDGRWLIRIFLGRDPETGRRRYLNHPFAGNKKAARSKLTALLNERDTGALVEPAKLTLDEYLDKWIETAATPRVRPRTLRGYEELLTRYIRPHLGKHPLFRITPLDIQAVYARLLADKLSPRTVRHAHGVLRSALNQAVRWRMLPSNPATLVDLPRYEKREMTALGPKEAMKFLKAARGDRLSALFALAVTTGMRPGEYLGLQWKDVDLQRGLVTVRRSLVQKPKGGWYYAEPKTPRSARTIPLPASVTKALEQHRQQQSQERLKCADRYTDNDLVFATKTGDPIHERNLVNRHFKPILKEAELPTSLRLYDLRHTCATLLLSEGENPKVVSERLGHASITLTLDTYSHVLPTMQQQAAARLEAALFASGD